MNFIGSRYAFDALGFYLLIVWHTPKQEIGITIREDGLYLYVQNHDGTNYRSEIKHTWRGAVAWACSEIQKDSGREFVRTYEK